MSNEIVPQKPRKILDVMAENLFAPSPVELLEILKNTTCKNLTENQIKMFLLAANIYKLNPLLGEIYAAPNQNGGIAIGISVDGWSHIINEHPQFKKMEIQMAEDGKSCTCSIWRKDRENPTVITEFLSECYQSDKSAWKKYPRRMLRHKAIKECARIALGFSGLYDTDDIDNIRKEEREEKQVLATENLSERLKSMADNVQDAEFELKDKA